MKNLKKFAAFGIAAAMTVSMGVSAFAADPALVANGNEKAINFKTGEAGADISVSTDEDQITVLAYLVDEKGADGNAYTTANVPEVGNASEIVAINQVDGATGFGEIPLDVNKLVSGKVMVVKLGGSDGTVDTYIVKYNEDTETIEILVGDVDGNAEVNGDDAAYMTLYFAKRASQRKQIVVDEATGKTTNIGEEITTDVKIGDVDGNGEVNGDDAAYMTLYFAKRASQRKQIVVDETTGQTTNIGETIKVNK